MVKQILKGHLCFQAKCKSIQNLDQLITGWLEALTWTLPFASGQGLKHTTEFYSPANRLKHLPRDFLRFLDLIFSCKFPIFIFCPLQDPENGFKVSVKTIDNLRLTQEDARMPSKSHHALSYILLQVPPSS